MTRTLPAATSAADTFATVERLLGRVTRGEASALTALYDETAPRVLGLVSRVLGPGQYAQDVTFAVYVALWQGEEQPPAGASLPWLLQVAHRWAVTRLRLRVPAQRGPGSRAGQAFPPEKEWLPELTEAERLALSEVYLRGQTVNRADVRLGWRPGTSLATVHQAMLHLAELHADPRSDHGGAR